MKKTFYLTICLLATMIMVSCANSSDKERISQLEAQIEELQNRGNNYNSSMSSSQTSNYESTHQTSSVTQRKNGTSLVGKYRINDDVSEWILDVNSDGTCQFHSNGNTYYGTWESCDDCYDFNMSDFVYFVVNGKRGYFMPHVDLNCQWLYDTSSSLKARNPNKRVELIRMN